MRIVSLKDKNETYEVAEGDNDGVEGVYVKNTDYNTETFFSHTAIEKGEIHDLIAATHHGRNVENITRVTGFFSKTQGWNKGKTGELKERNRVEIGKDC